MHRMDSPLAGRNILVTGGTGSFGHAFVKRALGDGAHRVVVFSRDELKQAQMCAEIPDDRVRFFIGDVAGKNADRDLVQAMRDVDIVCHAAAMKRIEQCEANPREAKRINIDGTENVAYACAVAGVGRGVMLSTDKAPNACTFYGMTKAAAERLWLQSNVYGAGTSTRLSAVRYGNVLASRGSVVGLFREQHAKGEALTITDHAMTRFWLRLDDAVNLVLLALQTMRGGEILVPKAPSSTIATLGSAVAGGNDPVRFQFIGLRPNERLYETLITTEESRSTYDAGSHYIVEPESRTWGLVKPPFYPKVPEGFVYRSDTNEWRVSAEDLRAMVAA